ncbi:MAG: hypothetical protein NTY07_10205 [Bacteroidia bacterium]|nr:hypothetical protein [Bacteroidia bacterium]
MKTIKKALIFVILMIYSTAFVFCQENDFISRLKTQLLLYRTQMVNQDIVIQTDKTLYRPGETIWMKGYVADAITHVLSLNSLELSVLLANNKGVNLVEGKYLLKNGVVDCRFTIPADLQSDDYYLIAYTPEMENIGIQAVFKKNIFIGSPEHLDVVPNLEYSKPFFTPEQKETATIRLKDFDGKPLSGKKFEYQIVCDKRELLSGKGKTGANGAGEIVFFTPSQQNGSPMMVSLDVPSGNDRLNLISKVPLASEKINITFFPDGGKLVPGIPQMVIYEATDQLGKPVSIRAEIIDEQGKFLSATATIQPGLGVLSLLNNNVNTLKLRITSDIGKGQETSLPSLSPGSMSLSVKKNDGKNLSLLLGRSPKSELSKFMIVAVSNGEMIWASDFELEQAGVLNVPLENFRSEIAAIAVFSETGMLIAQRLVYTGKKQSLNISLTPNKSGYKKGEAGDIKLKIADSDGKPVKAELAVSLADHYAFPASSSCVNFLTYGLEKPFPFKEPLDKVNRIALDYLLATNSMKGFDWSQVVAIDPAKTTNIRLGAMRVSGKVVDSKDLPVPNALVSLTGLSLQQFNARSDQNGEFFINLPVPVEKKNLSASATDGSGKGNYRVILNKSFKDELVNSLTNTSVNDWQILDQLYQSDYFKENPDFLKAGSSSKVRGGDKVSREPYWKKNLNSTTNLIDIIKTIRPFEMMGGKIVFRGGNSLNYQDGALIVVDGIRMGTDPSALTSISPHDVEDIQIFVNPVDMSRYTSLNSVGVIEIKTKHGKGNNGPSETDVSQKVSDPTIFKPETIGNDRYDLKTTLQWIPVVFTDEKGEATIPFKTGGIKSNFVFEIAGFTDQGQWIGSQTEITVK